jgi:MFS family permease
MPGAIGIWTSSQIAARIYPRIGPRRMAVGGLCGVISVFCLLGLAVGFGTSIWAVRLLTLGNGFANGFCVIAVQTSSFATISSADTGRASALFQTQTRIAGSIGVAMLVTIVSAAAPAGTAGAALVPAFHYAFLACAAVTVLALGFALTIRDADAAATMRRRDLVPAAAPAPAAGPSTADPGVRGQD